ncbi:MAG: branched-chain-amino-acid transaminase [Abditibacteriota bacterium]|jgi:branched-chain amino acid aminotransferase|nr:branched-chain-amino-acid transaminase [Abditibacteriota bacterium]MBP5093878.1 branched-chain-amino-acid transaminase [Abditibacteriota bacterium]MBP5717820.1 branched-chain-amino-acid transaminase [Abditibacteriota bacterium]MBP5739143.1 branched-chain-amino-acid transaminase [Abditibacteriota bacterium]
MNNFVFLNGDFIPFEDAHLSIYDHGFMYGDGAFEGIRAYNGEVFRLKDHVHRLYNACKALWINMPYGEDVFAENMKKLVKMNEVKDAYIRVTVSRGVSLGLDPKKIKCDPTVVISTSQLALYPESAYQNGLDVVTVATRVAAPDILEPRIKSTGKYVANIQAKMEANFVGAGEGLMLTPNGYVAECTGDNIFFVKDGEVCTPAAFLGILEGITRKTVLEILDAQGIKVKQGTFTRFDLYTADEAFLTGTAAEVIPMVQLDGRPIADGKPGPLTLDTLKRFREFTQKWRN